MDHLHEVIRALGLIASRGRFVQLSAQHVGDWKQNKTKKQKKTLSGSSYPWQIIGDPPMSEIFTVVEKS